GLPPERNSWDSLLCRCRTHRRVAIDNIRLRKNPLWIICVGSVIPANVILRSTAKPLHQYCITVPVWRAVGRVGGNTAGSGGRKVHAMPAGGAPPARVEL